MVSRLSIAGVLCLVVLAAGAAYVFRESLSGSAPPTPLADSVGGAGRPSPQAAPSEQAASGGVVAPPAPGPSAAGETVSPPGEPSRHAQAVGAAAGSSGKEAASPLAAGAPPSPVTPSPVVERPAQVDPPAVLPAAKVEAAPTAGGSAAGETAPPIKVAEAPANSEPPPPAGPPTDSATGVAPRGETPPPPAPSSEVREDTPSPPVEAKPITAMTPPVEPPRNSQASPAVATPAPTPVPPAAQPERAAESAARDDAPAAPAQPTPIAPVPTPVTPSAVPLFGPVAEGPAPAEMQAAPPLASPPAESAAKDEAPAPQQFDAKPIVAPAPPTAPPAPMQAVAPPKSQSAESATKDETLRAEPLAPVAEVPAQTEAPAVSPPVKPAAERLANADAAAPAKVAESPAPVQPPAGVEPKPAAESLGKDEAAAPAQPPATPPAKSNAQSVPPPASEPVPPVEPAPIVIGKPPAPGGAEPAAPTPKSDASASTTGVDQGQLAAIIPPRAPQAMLAIDDATVGKDYAADLPPFSDPNGAKSIALHVEPAPPEGLSFVDLGSGFGAISGKPTKPGRYVFDVIASNSGGGAARMTMKINVAAAPSDAKPQPELSRGDANPQVAALEPIDKAARFLSGFDGGPCFLARVGVAAGDSTAAEGGGARGSIAIEGVGSQKAVFERFYVSFIRDVGVEPTFAVRLIAPPQCPAIKLIAAAHADRAAAPTIKLAAYDVAHGKPLAGSIGALAGRRLDVLLITNDGLAHKIVSRGAAGDQNAPFSVPITPDAGSIGALQILVAIVSPKPLDALATFRSGPSTEILPKVAAQLEPADATVSVEYFRFLK